VSVAIKGRRYKHFKRGSIYQVEHIAKDCNTPAVELVVYRNVETDEVWVRERHDFQGSTSVGVDRFEMQPVSLSRPTEDEYYFRIVEAVAQRGTCSRRKVGAVAVREGRILATGYNGAPAGARHCDHEAYHGIEDDPDLYLVDGRASCSRAIHSEANVLAYAARYGVSVEGSIIYCDTYPCYPCAKAMVSAGVAGVRFQSDYVNDPRVEQLTKETNFTVTRARG
jgi:dCMP deaminase